MSSNIKVNRICRHCGNEFIARTTVTQFCGDQCAKRAYKIRQRATKIESSNIETVSIKLKAIEDLKLKEYLTVRDLAKLLNCSIRTTYRIIKEGKIKAVNLAERKTMIRRTEVDKLFS